mgnify:CR=1 FL=1
MYKLINKIANKFTAQNFSIEHKISKFKRLHAMKSRQKWLNSLDLNINNIESLISTIESEGGLLSIWDMGNEKSKGFKAYDHICQILDNLQIEGQYEYYFTKVKTRLPRFYY